MTTETPRPEEPLKQHGDKLGDVLGSPKPAKQDDGAPAEESLKVHGDKLQSSVDKALGDGGAR